jgi:hypothetical protein
MDSKGSSYIKSDILGNLLPGLAVDIAHLQDDLAHGIIHPGDGIHDLCFYIHQPDNLSIPALAKSMNTAML